MRFRSAYDLGEADYSLHFPDDEPSLTVQSEANACDINLIVERARRGIMPITNPAIPQFGDFSDVPDYQTAFERVQAAQAAFDSLPAAVRRRFDNDPALLLNFLNDERNKAEAVELGLLEPAQVNDLAAGTSPPVAPQRAGSSVAADTGS